MIELVIEFFYNGLRNLTFDILIFIFIFIVDMVNEVKAYLRYNTNYEDFDTSHEHLCNFFFQLRLREHPLDVFSAIQCIFQHGFLNLICSEEVHI